MKHYAVYTINYDQNASVVLKQIRKAVDKLIHLSPMLAAAGAPLRVNEGDWLTIYAEHDEDVWLTRAPYQNEDGSRPTPSEFVRELRSSPRRATQLINESSGVEKLMTYFVACGWYDTQ